MAYLAAAGLQFNKGQRWVEEIITEKIDGTYLDTCDSKRKYNAEYYNNCDRKKKRTKDKVKTSEGMANM